MPHPLDEDRAVAPSEPVRVIHPPTRSRSIIFTLWIVAMILFGLYAAYVWSAYMPELSRRFGNGLVVGVLVALIVEVFAALGILMWKRWGIYGLMATLLVNLVLRGVMGVLDATSLTSALFALVMLLVFVRPKWEFYT